MNGKGGRGSDRPVGRTTVDYRYLFGKGAQTVRHDPQVRFQVAEAPVDLGMMASLARARARAE